MPICPINHVNIVIVVTVIQKELCGVEGSDHSVVTITSRSYVKVSLTSERTSKRFIISINTFHCKYHIVSHTDMQYRITAGMRNCLNKALRYSIDQ